MVVDCLIHYSNKMSGLPKRKYQKLTSDTEFQFRRISSASKSTESSFEDADPNEAAWTTESLTVDENQGAAELSSSVNIQSDHTPIDRSFSNNSNTIPEIQSNEQISAQFYDAFHRLSSSHSESWFTASSVMGDSMTNSVEIPMKSSNKTPTLLTDTQDVESMSALYATPVHCLTQKKSADISTVDEHEVPSVIPEHTSATARPRFIHKNSDSTQKPNSGTSQMALQTLSKTRETYPNEILTTPMIVDNRIIPARDSSQTSPAKLLRMRWKRLFITKKHTAEYDVNLSGEIEMKDSPYQANEHSETLLTHQIAASTSKIDDFDSTDKTPKKNFEVSEALSKKALPTKSAKNTHQPLAQSDLSLSGAVKIPQINSISKSDKDLTDLSLRYYSKDTSRLSETSAQIINAIRPSPLGDRWIHGRISLPTPQGLRSMYTQCDSANSRRQAWKQSKCTSVQENDGICKQTAESVYVEAPENFDNLVTPFIPEEYKSSFEKEDENEGKLIEREAHLGALALAWASGTRKSRLLPKRVASERVDRNTSSQRRIKSPLAVNTVEEELQKPCITGTISSHILGHSKSRKTPSKYSTSNETDSQISSSVKLRTHHSFLGAFACSSTKSSCLPLGLVRDSFRRIDRSSTEAAKCERLEELGDKSTTDVRSEKPVSTALTSKTTSEKTIKTVQIRLFSGRQNESLKVLNTTQDDKHEKTSLESTSILLGEDGLPIGQRAQMRRNAQDITPLYPSGGPLGSTQQALLQKPQTHNIGWRLSQRKILNERRRKISDYCFGLAIVGILLMVLELEFLMAGVYTRESFYSLIMKSLISTSTFMLVFLIILYHAVDIQLFSVNNCIEDWRIATNCKKMGFVILEILLCMIHPPPVISNTNWSAGQLPFQNLDPEVSPFSVDNVSHTWRSGDDIPTNKNSKFSTPNISSTSATPSVQYAQLSLSYQNYISYTTTQLPDPVYNTDFRTDTLNVHNKFISLELILAIPMFLRLYLIFRVLLLHSTFFTDAGSRSIGALNRVKINVRFILKRQATARPGTMLLIFILSMWIITSWIMRVCERQINPDLDKMLNTMWLIAVTFLSIGYGDVVPNTHCGRSISVIAGVMVGLVVLMYMFSSPGSACTALVVAVVARKLELTRAEKHVHNFMQDNKVYKQLRHSAANVLRETWLFYKHTRLVKRVFPARVRRHQRKFLQAINRLRKAKDKQRKLKEDANSMVDLVKLQTGIHEMVSYVRTDQAVFVQRLISVEKCMNQLQIQLNQLPETLTDLLNSPTKRLSDSTAETVPLGNISKPDPGPNDPQHSSL